MVANTVDELVALYKERIAAKDVDGVLDLYEQNAVLVLPDGTSVVGRTSIRSILEMVVAGPAVEFEDGSELAFECGDVALSHLRWRAGDSGPFSAASDVFRRGTDGGWLVSIDNGFGTAVLPK